MEWPLWFSGLFYIFITLYGIRAMGLLPDTQNCGLRMRRECRERFPRHRLQMKPRVNDPGMHHGTCVTHVPWVMSGSLTRGGGENVPGIPGLCTTHNFTYLARGLSRGTTVFVWLTTFGTDLNENVLNEIPILTHQWMFQLFFILIVRCTWNIYC